MMIPSPGAQKASSGGTSRQAMAPRAMSHPWGPAPKPPEFTALGQWALGKPVSWHGIDRTTTRGTGPFGEHPPLRLPSGRAVSCGRRTMLHARPFHASAICATPQVRPEKTSPRTALTPCQPPPQTAKNPPSGVVHFEVITGGAF